MNSLKIFLYSLVCVPAFSCNRKVMKANLPVDTNSDSKHAAPIDALATKETKALYKNLLQLSSNHTLFGHQHATEYGHGWSGDVDRSDVKSVTGSHPAVIGIDVSGFTGRPAIEVEKAYRITHNSHHIINNS